MMMIAEENVGPKMEHQLSPDVDVVRLATPAPHSSFTLGLVLPPQRRTCPCAKPSPRLSPRWQQQTIGNLSNRAATKRGIIRKKSLWSLFWVGQRSGHHRSLKAKIRRFVGQMPTIFNKSTHSSETNKATAPRKSAFDSPINALSEQFSQI